MASSCETRNVACTVSCSELEEGAIVTNPPSPEQEEVFDFQPFESAAPAQAAAALDDNVVHDEMDPESEVQHHQDRWFSVPDPEPENDLVAAAAASSSNKSNIGTTASGNSSKDGRQSQHVRPPRPPVSQRNGGNSSSKHHGGESSSPRRFRGYDDVCVGDDNEVPCSTSLVVTNNDHSTDDADDEVACSSNTIVPLDDHALHHFDDIVQAAYASSTLPAQLVLEEAVYRSILGRDEQEAHNSLDELRRRKRREIIGLAPLRRALTRYVRRFVAKRQVATLKHTQLVSREHLCRLELVCYESNDYSLLASQLLFEAEAMHRALLLQWVYTLLYVTAQGSLRLASKALLWHYQYDRRVWRRTPANLFLNCEMHESFERSKLEQQLAVQVDAEHAAIATAVLLPAAESEARGVVVQSEEQRRQGLERTRRRVLDLCWTRELEYCEMLARAEGVVAAEHREWTEVEKLRGVALSGGGS